MDPKKNQSIRSYEIVQAMAALVVVFAIVLITFLLWFDLFFLAIAVFGITVWTIRTLKQRAEHLRRTEMLLELAKEQLSRQIGLMFEDIQKSSQIDIEYSTPMGRLGEKTIYQWAIWDGVWFEYEGLAPEGMMSPVVIDPKSVQKVVLQGCVYIQKNPPEPLRLDWERERKEQKEQMSLDGYAQDVSERASSPSSSDTSIDSSIKQ